MILIEKGGILFLYLLFDWCQNCRNQGGLCGYLIGTLPLPSPLFSSHIYTPSHVLLHCSEKL